MAYFGKQFKRADTKNIKEFLDAFNVPENVRGFMLVTESITTFEKNDDGSLQQIVEIDGNKVVNHKIVFEVENEFPIPNGTPAKFVYTMQGDLLKTTITHPEGYHVYIDTHFETDKITLNLSSDKTDVKAALYLKAV